MHKIAVALLFLVGICGSYCAWWFIASRFGSSATIAPSLSSRVDGREATVTIFVHGTFGTMLGLLSFMPVVKDDIKGSLYNKLLRKMRKDPFFYKDQPIYARGLHKLTPTFDLSVTSGCKHAAYAIANAYDIIQETVAPGEFHNDYYTFGWSGFMSKARRRSEAIRLYNALNELMASYAVRGIKPKIRIIAHSHGGNLALQLAGINELMLQGIKAAQEKYSDDQDRNDALTDLSRLLSTLPPSRAGGQIGSGQKRWDYLPEKGGLIVDELVLLGTPIQPETDHYCYSQTFKKVYNLYSGEDYIQKMDWVSSRRYFSEQRFDVTKWKTDKQTGEQEKVSTVKLVAPATNVVQGKIMVNSEDNTVTMTSQNPSDGASSTWWKKLLLERAPNRRASDPSHKELWFIMRTSQEKLESSIVSPVPIVVFVPVFKALLDQVPTLEDIDFHLSVRNGKLLFQVTAHDERAAKKTVSLPVSLVNELKSHMVKWGSDTSTQEKEFELIRQYVHHAQAG